MEVVIIVDRKEVSMNVSISQQHIHTRYAMDSLEEVVELQETTWAISLQSKAAVFCLKLMQQK